MIATSLGKTRAAVAKKTDGIVLAVSSIAARPCSAQTDARSAMKASLNWLREPKGRPGKPSGLPDWPGFHRCGNCVVSVIFAAFCWLFLGAESGAARYAMQLCSIRIPARLLGTAGQTDTLIGGCLSCPP